MSDESESSDYESSGNDEKNLGLPPVNRDPNPGGLLLQPPPNFLNPTQEFQYIKPGQAGGRRQKGWGERLFYETGVSYITGGAVFGSYGAARGFLNPQGTGFKLRLNSALNNAGKLGAYWGNSFGVFALVWSMSRSFAKSQRRQNDVYNDIIGFAAAGFLTSFPKGIRPAIGMGAGMTVVGAALVSINLKYQEYRDS